jgi:hypothetical protein
MILGSWAPDLPPFGHSELVEARNTYSNLLGYAPVRSLSAVTAAMGENWTGAGAFQSIDGVNVLLAGTGTDLYKLTASAATSKLAGAFISPWFFAQFGNFVLGVNGGAPVKYNIGTDTAASLGGSPPSSTMIAIVRDQVFVAGKPTALNTVTWSAINDSEGWTIGTNQCDDQQIPDGGNITGLAGGEYGLVFQSGSIHIFEYVGTPLIYTRRKISDGVGALSHGAITQNGKQTFFLDRSGFYELVDGQLNPIGKDRVDRTFFDTYSVAEIKLRCRASVDPARKLVMWSMPDRLWVYNWGTQKWSDIYEVGIVGVCQGQTSETTLEDIAVLYPAIEDVPVSFDDPAWRGGDPMVLVAKTDFKLHTFGGADAMAAVFRMPRIEPFKGRGTYVRNARVDTDALDGVTLSIDTSARLGNTQDRTQSTDLRANGDMPIRCYGRYVQPQVDIAAATDWTYVNGLDVAATAGGRL